jgi:hypothetical protein
LYRPTKSVAHLVSLMRVLARCANESFVPSSSLMALALLAVRQRMWLVACVRRTRAVLLAFVASLSSPR